MTDARRSSARRPGPGAVLWGSVALFAVLFALLTFQFSASSESSGTGVAARPVQVRKVIKRRIVTTIVPSPGTTSVSSGPVTSSATSEPPAPVTTSAS